MMKKSWNTAFLNRLAAQMAPKTSGERPKIHVELFFPSAQVNEDADVMVGSMFDLLQPEYF